MISSIMRSLIIMPKKENINPTWKDGTRKTKKEIQEMNEDEFKIWKFTYKKNEKKISKRKGRLCLPETKKILIPQDVCCQNKPYGKRVSNKKKDFITRRRIS